MLVIPIGQSSKNTGMIALDHTYESRDASDDLQQIFSIHPLSLIEGSCPVNDISEFESAINSNLLVGKVDAVNECCGQICQNAICEAARKIALTWWLDRHGYY
ncbi:putative GPI-anchored protein [Cocos nucifera]|nr:putative GPI-anchored protein [Cocos nucifera]